MVETAVTMETNAIIGCIVISCALVLITALVLWSRRTVNHIARGIVSAIREKKTRMLVLGWHGRSSKSIFNIGSTIDPVIEQAPCNVVVLKDCGGNKSFKNILVPVAGGNVY
jgi:hypothetical protein